MVQEVEEGVAVGVGTGVQHRQHGDEPAVNVLDVCRAEDTQSHNEQLIGPTPRWIRLQQQRRWRHTQCPGQALEQLGGHQRLRQLSEVQFEDPADDVDLGAPQPGNCFTEI